MKAVEMAKAKGKEMERATAKVTEIERAMGTTTTRCCEWVIRSFPACKTRC